MKSKACDLCKCTVSPTFAMKHLDEFANKICEHDELLQNINIDKLQTIDSKTDLIKFNGELAYFDGSIWKKKSGSTTSNGGNFAGTLLNVNLNSYWERDIYNKEVNPEWWGAISDWNNSLRTATDCTDAFQKAIDYLISINGGKLIVSKRYLINGTVYINCQNSVAITIEGFGGYNIGGTINGSTIYRQVSGDVFRVNYKADNTAFLTFPELYARFSIKGINGVRVRKSDNTLETGMVFLKTFRVQSATIKDCGVTGFDYLISQPDTDANNIENYCDQWLIQNVNAHNSTKGFMKLYLSDATIVSRFTFHDPLDGADEGITLKSSTTTLISEGVFWNPTGSDTTITNSSYINLIGCRAVKIQNIHFERVHYESAIKITASNSISVSSIHSRYSSNIFFLLNNNKGVRISEWDSWEDKNVGGKDVSAFLNNTDISIDNSYFSSFSTSLRRDPIFDGDIRFNEDSHLEATDLNYTVLNTDKNLKLRLPTITNNRIITLPNPIPNIRLTIYNRNNSAFTWSTNQQLLLQDGTSITVLKNNSTYVIEGNSTGSSAYRVVSILSSDIVYLNSNNTYTGTNRFSNNVSIGGNVETTTNLYIDKNLEGGSEATGVWSRGITQTPVSNAIYYRTTAQSVTGSSLTDLIHYRASQGTYSGAVAQQRGFVVESNLIGAVNNQGFVSQIPFGSNRWNLFISGTAINYLAGGLTIGSTTLPSSALLNLTSTTQGFLPPRMTAAQASAISSPAEGLMLYVTDTNGTFTSKGWYGFNGATWDKFNN